MTDYSREAAAERAGVSLEEVSRLVEVGIIHAHGEDRFSAGEIRKIGLITSLVDSGLPLEGLAAVLAQPAMSLDFMETPAYERFAALGDETFGERAGRTGVPVELVMLAREAIGGAQPTPDDRVSEGELPIIEFIEAQVKLGFRPAAIERVLRVQGDSLRRVTESEADWWRTEIILPAMAAGGGIDSMANPDQSARLSALTEGSLLANYHAQQARAWTGNFIDGFEAVLAQAGYTSRVEHPPAMCFLDITGYTRLTDERGDQAAATLAADLGRLVQRSSVQHGGKAVKWLGDGVMFWFRDPGAGVIAALEMCDGVRGAGLPPAHVGLHAGPVVYQQGDYYGQTVNIASRIADYARPGEVLVSQSVVEASAGTRSANLDFTDIGPVELKGVGTPIRLHSARRA